MIDTITIDVPRKAIVAQLPPLIADYTVPFFYDIIGGEQVRDIILGSLHTEVTIPTIGANGTHMGTMHMYIGFTPTREVHEYARVRAVGTIIYSPSGPSFKGIIYIPIASLTGILAQYFRQRVPTRLAYTLTNIYTTSTIHWLESLSRMALSLSCRYGYQDACNYVNGYLHVKV